LSPPDAPARSGVPKTLARARSPRHPKPAAQPAGAPRGKRAAGGATNAGRRRGELARAARGPARNRRDLALVQVQARARRRRSRHTARSLLFLLPGDSNRGCGGTMKRTWILSSTFAMAMGASSLAFAG